MVLNNNRYGILSLLKDKCGINVEEENIEVWTTSSDDEEMPYSLETIESSELILCIVPTLARGYQRL